MNLRRLAKGKPCMARLHCCNHDPETTVLAHKNGAGQSIKHNDLLACWSCSSCHAWLDGGYANQGYTRPQRDALHDEAIIRTQQELLKMGLSEVIEKWRL